MTNFLYPFHKSSSNFPLLKQLLSMPIFSRNICLKTENDPPSILDSIKLYGLIVNKIHYQYKIVYFICQTLSYEEKVQIPLFFNIIRRSIFEPFLFKCLTRKFRLDLHSALSPRGKPSNEARIKLEAVPNLHRRLL